MFVRDTMCSKGVQEHPSSLVKLCDGGDLKCKVTILSHVNTPQYKCEQHENTPSASPQTTLCFFLTPYGTFPAPNVSTRTLLLRAHTLSSDDGRGL